VLGLLSRFFATCPATRLDLYFEAVSGPVERLCDGEADLILHRVDKSDARLEWVDLAKVTFVPVVAPGFLREPVARAIRPAQMRDYTQCVMRDTARHTPSRDYFTIAGARQCTVADQLMKKEIILQGMGWGHMPRFLIEEELRDGRLRSIANPHLPGSVEELVAARRLDVAQGPVSNRLWRYLQDAAPGLRRALNTCPSAARPRPARAPRGPAP
jgi:DNA-binding transcriptional LysR family regulator